MDSEAIKKLTIMTPNNTECIHLENENLPEKSIYDRLLGTRTAQSDIPRNQVRKRLELQKHVTVLNKKRRHGQITTRVNGFSLKRVSFSDISRMHVYRNKTPKINLAYSKKERKTFAKDAITTAHRIDAVIAADKNNDFNHPIQAAMEEIIGIEQFINGAKIARSNSVERKKHRHAILMEQNRQIITKNHDPSRIASISSYFSEQAVRRANIRAAFVHYLEQTCQK